MKKDSSVRHKTGGRRRTTLVFMTIMSLSLWIAVATAGAGTYYVSPAGSDSNSGSSSAPFKTIQKAANIVNAGDTVIVENGTYTDTDGDGSVVHCTRGGTASAPVTFKAQNKWGAVVDGQNNATNTGFDIVANYIQIEGFEIKGAASGGIWSNNSNTSLYIYGNKIHDIGRRQNNQPYGEAGVFTGSGTSFTTIDSNEFYNIGRLNPYTTPSATEASCLYNGSNVACYALDHGLYLNGHDNDVINNIFYPDFKSGFPIQIKGSNGSGDGPNWNIINNTIYGGNPMEHGHIYLDRATGGVTMSNILIENNISDSATSCLVNAGAQGSANVALNNNLLHGITTVIEGSSSYTSSNNTTGDPLFVNLTNRDFHLQSTSPAIRKGSTTDAPTYDFDDNTRTVPPDLGSFEYAAATSSTTTSTDTTPPSTPTGLTAKGASTSQINLSWTASTDNVGVSGYKVYRSGSLIATATTTSYSDTGLPASTTYTYTVSAFDAVGNTSAQSVSASAATMAASDTTAPSVPAGLTATPVSSSQINLSWTASTDNVGVSGYKVYRNGSLIATATTTSYSDTGLPASTTYTYTVSAFDAVGNTSAQSVSASAATMAASDTTAPSVPAGLTATPVSSSQINLSWTASTDNVGVSGYKVYRNGSLIATATTTSYSDTGLPASTTYTYTIAAYDAAGNVSALSASASATTKAASDTTAPSVPAGLTATTVSTSQINLSWTASTDNVGVAGYRIYRSGTLIATTQSTSYSNMGLPASTTYTYTVAAYDAAGNVSALSASAAATTLAGTTTNTTTTATTVIVDNGGAGTSHTGSWYSSSAPNPYGSNSLYAYTTGTSFATYTWSAALPKSGTYTVYAWWTSNSNRTTAAPYTITYSGGSTNVIVNQQINGGQWIKLGTFTFGTSGKVTLTASGSYLAVVSADAIKFVSQ